MGKFNAMVAEMMENEEIKAFIAEHEMTENEISKSYSNFYEYLNEKRKFIEGTQTTMTDYEPTLVMTGAVGNRFAKVIYRETEEHAKKLKLRKIYRNLEASSIVPDPTIKKATFDKFVIKTAEEQKAFDFAKRIAEFYKQGGQGNVGFSGTAGTGKSHLSMAILRDYVSDGTHSAVFASFSRVASLAQDYYNNKESKYSKEYFLQLFENVDLLVLDDIGAEKITEYTENILESILDSRTRTIFTTNLSSGELKASYHERTYDRLTRGMGMDKAFNFEGIKSKRKTQLPF